MALVIGPESSAFRTNNP